MAEQSQETAALGSADSHGQTRSAAEHIRQLTEASKQLFDAGKQITESLSQLTRRAEHASDVGSQVLTSPWLIAAGAVIAGTAVILLSKRR
jgi:acyl-[acyl carrier protein]--UDP-N-acetylglucosamine O-acyltransferase